MATAKPQAGEGGAKSNEKCVGASKRRGSSNSDSNGGKSGGGGKGVHKVHSPDIADGSGPVRKGMSLPESKNDIMSRFDDEVRKQSHPFQPACLVPVGQLVSGTIRIGRV